MANGRRRQQPDRHMSGEARAASPPPAARPGRTNSSTRAHTASRPSSCPSYSAGRPQPHPPPLSYTSLLTHTYPPAAAAPHTTTPQATPLYPPSHCGQRPTGDEKRLRRARPTRSPPRPPNPTLRQEAVVPPPPPPPLAWLRPGRPPPRPKRTQQPRRAEVHTPHLPPDGKAKLAADHRPRERQPHPPAVRHGPAERRTTVRTVAKAAAAAAAGGGKRARKRRRPRGVEDHLHAVAVAVVDGVDGGPVEGNRKVGGRGGRGGWKETE